MHFRGNDNLLAGVRLLSNWSRVYKVLALEVLEEQVLLKRSASSLKALHFACQSVS